MIEAACSSGLEQEEGNAESAKREDAEGAEKAA
jgi:hypothetical protein